MLSERAPTVIPKVSRKSHFLEIFGKKAKVRNSLFSKDPLRSPSGILPLSQRFEGKDIFRNIQEKGQGALALDPGLARHMVFT